MDIARRVYLRYAFSRDPKVVNKEFEKLHQALEHLEKAKGALDAGPNFHAYSQAIESFRNIKFFVEHAGGSVGQGVSALETLSKNPFVPEQATSENPKVFKDAIAEVAALKGDFEKVQQTKAGASLQLVPGNYTINASTIYLPPGFVIRGG